MENNINYNIQKNDPEIYIKLKKSLLVNGFAIIKGFIPKSIIRNKVKKFKSNFNHENDVKSTGRYKDAMKNFSRLDLGDFASRNARFSRMISSFRWNEDSFFKEEIDEMVYFRNSYLGIENETAKGKYLHNDNTLIDIPKILHYPKGGGFLVKHQDIYANEILSMNVLLNLTKKGIDFKSGGVYYVTDQEEFLDVDSILEEGDHF